MPLTEQDRAWHETYEQMDPEARSIANRAIEAAQRVLRLNGLATAQDDRAEQLAAAVARYVVLSNPDLPDLLVNTMRNAVLAHAPAKMGETERHARALMIEVAVKHKDLFGVAATKQLIFRYGHSRSLADVPMENVPALHRVLQGAIDRQAEKDDAYLAGVKAMNAVTPRGQGRIVAKHPDLGAPYGREPVLVRESTPTGRNTSPWSSPEPGVQVFDTGAFWNTPPSRDEETKVAGGGGSFDGGGASGSWDSSPSSGDPSPSND